MLWVTDYRLKPHMSKADVKRLMDIFGKRGAATGGIGHYVRTDGTGGYTITETDDIVGTFGDVLAYSEFMTFTTTPVLKVDDAVGPIFEYIA